ncbi:hypothetical protein K490DRAFT_72569 [Saccharata proteae CBS 121410]|uniref:Gem-associated protein 5 TPR domain-containing protein n=1 Tax=Saccharata proteae CBS 121410 TaxID=1314787 RepID=A0A6A5YAK8_9PEZI|nr:hypothetical protein K490DRAFT_72569 [Saccharata proteae CBS 121410]
MSAGQLRTHRSTSRSTSRSENAIPPPPAPSTTPRAAEFEPCAATATFFLYAQRNVILCLHYDTLAIERRFAQHREDVAWISVDNVSERGAGRLVVSYDVGNTAIVWDLLTGDEVARFASYEHIKVAAWMRNGNIAFGNSQGNVILFEPSTSEHISARTIFDPITALAPAADCRTFAIGYLNGSILIATLQPSFTILHTLTTPRAPSPINGLAWHGSSSKQKSEMLATQSSDGDLRVWSVPKAPHTDPPCVIRILNRSESSREPGPCWFGWSKNGRIVQYSEGLAYAWDVRTKKVTYEPVPTTDGVTAIANYGPQATLFTLARNHTVQQYDVNPNNNAPMLVANVQHVPANAPPSPPNSIEEKKEQKAPAEPAPALPVYMDSVSSGDEAVAMSPLQKIAQEMDQLEEESRDRVGPLSPVSSRSSNASSRSSGGARKHRYYRYDKPSSSRGSEGSAGEGTIFSSGSSYRDGRESISIRSTSSFASSKHRSTRSVRSSGLRNEMLRSPDEAKNDAMDLFPFIQSRLSDVPFRMPPPGSAKTPDELRRQMLSVVFGWEDDIDALVRDELANHAPGSASGVLLSKWLGDNGADLMASMVGSESMTSSDWMLLALSSMGQDSQKKVGQAFVLRLLEKGDIHPAVAILLGLGEQNDAVEAYVSRKYYMEAVILTCLLYPTDWQRQSFLVRKWGEVAVTTGQPELAVRCFYCTSLESSEPWSSPRAQDAVYTAQQQQLMSDQLSPPLSPPPTSAKSARMKNSALKLITDFGEKPAPQMLAPKNDRADVGVTPIAESALSPGGHGQWLRPTTRSSRDPSSARTATPGAYRRKRFPSKPDFQRSATAESTPYPGQETPQPTTAFKSIDETATPRIPRLRGLSSSGRTTDDERSQSGLSQSDISHDDASQEEPMLLSAVAYDPSETKTKMGSFLPSPAVGVFEQLKQQSRSRNGSRDRKPERLQLDVFETVVTNGPESSSVAGLRTGRTAELSPPLTSSSIKSAKIRSIDQYISSLEEANFHARQQRPDSRNARSESRDTQGRTSRTARDRSQTRGRSGVRYIKPAKRSPSSPVPMSPEDAGLYSSNNETYDDERYYKIASPTESRAPRSRSRSKMRGGVSKVRSSSKASRRGESVERKMRSKPSSRAVSRNASRQPSPEGRLSSDEYSQEFFKPESSGGQSPTDPLPMSTERHSNHEQEVDFQIEVTSPVRSRQRSSSRRPGDRGLSSRREPSPERQRSHSRKAAPRDASTQRESPERVSSRQASRSRMPKLQTDFHVREPRGLSRKELAARELEERRLSLARRPSAPQIPHPEELSRPSMSGRSWTDLGNSPSSIGPPYSPHSEKGIQRSHTVDPEAMMRYHPRGTSGTSTTSTPIGLPATPRAMRHPRYMNTDPHERDMIPAVPEIPDHVINVEADRKIQSQDDLAPLLPSTVYGQTGPQGPQRSASAPPEHIVYNGNRRGSVSSRGSGNKRHSPPIASIDETLHENQVIIIDEPPPLLAELQHLAGPPPPPPPPSMFQPGHVATGSGVINIAIDENQGLSRTTTPLDSPPPPPVFPSGSPHMHRRGRGSVSETIGSRLRGVTDRMRSTSRSGSRAKSPPMESFTPSPYETVLPPFPFTRHDSVSRNNNKSPIGDNNGPRFDAIPPPPPPPPPPAAGGSAPLEQVIPPGQDKGYMRGPKEIRANMPPQQLQPGVVPMESGGMI